MHDNTEFVKKKREENAIMMAEDTKNAAAELQSKIDYNIMMGNLEDPEGGNDNE